MELVFDGNWITEYFRRRWVIEQNELVITDLRCFIMYLDRETAIAVLTGTKKIQTSVFGSFLVADNAVEIDGHSLIGES